jgi:hypothetical protein
MRLQSACGELGCARVLSAAGTPQQHAPHLCRAASPAPPCLPQLRLNHHPRASVAKSFQVYSLVGGFVGKVGDVDVGGARTANHCLVSYQRCARHKYRLPVLHKLISKTPDELQRVLYHSSSSVWELFPLFVPRKPHVSNSEEEAFEGGLAHGCRLTSGVKWWTRRRSPSSLTFSTSATNLINILLSRLSRPRRTCSAACLRQPWKHGFTSAMGERQGTKWTASSPRCL